MILPVEGAHDFQPLPHRCQLVRSWVTVAVTVEAPIEGSVVTCQKHGDHGDIYIYVYMIRYRYRYRYRYDACFINVFVMFWITLHRIGLSGDFPMQW